MGRRTNNVIIIYDFIFNFAERNCINSFKITNFGSVNIFAPVPLNEYKTTAEI